MDAINQWWMSLPAGAQWFYMAAAFFSVIFLWQLISAMIGLGHSGDGFGMDHPADVGHMDAAHAGAGHVEHPTQIHADAAFTLISVRSVLAFFTLFTWAGALYLTTGVELTPALLYATGWGLGAMFLVALLLYGMKRLAETGNINIASCVGGEGTVYIDIPADGMGEARVVCNGIVTVLRARGTGGAAIKSGTPIRITRTLGPNMIEVETISKEEKQ